MGGGGGRGGGGGVTYTALRVLGLPVERARELAVSRRGGGEGDVMVSGGWGCMRGGCGRGVGVGV